MRAFTAPVLGAVAMAAAIFALHLPLLIEEVAVGAIAYQVVVGYRWRAVVTDIHLLETAPKAI